ncbi:putative two-component system response regulator [Candidatus Hakubella thermalkaliphila]|uniref:Putative two-component system response regulator n=1 Tax=Candidatus Hakubella thermalkaliphila TaxID=2754717 RepID=A0A6V8QEE4_9ACTN|nr:HD-GYP domain-containing protein [Candidatus Hakubella thermalkaliphila]GFP18713.1 putative two-component system response regulator [Candidatus Hakubella thermalkaliphila]GFP29127.1 putative two-component system response regulator [Candidatus Hakubella thermalkaliphila]GFP36842.1 putative two-component system response regulator [Candidatus Hakubella thermalkaliphila]GFP38392.1 putative two-component system response regulator [Candidatus Hakubella thermalkaliphila]GFP43138.1 putative two-com
MAQKISGRLLAYILSVFLAGLGIFLYVYQAYPGISIEGAIAFGLLVLVTDNLAVMLPKAGAVSVAGSILMACLFVNGPVTASLISILQLLHVADFKNREPWYKYLFNGGQFLLAVGIGGIIFKTINRSGAFALQGEVVLAVVLSSLAYFVINTGLTAIAVSASTPERTSAIHTWLYNYAWLFPFHILVSIVAVGIALLYLRFGSVSLLFSTLPLILTQYIWLLTLRERKGVLDNIINMVRIMEAKDVYTAGHSRRVAQYAEKIGRELRLNEFEIDNLKNAAYLHDVGKIQIDLSVLNNEEQLSSEARKIFQSHVTVSAEITGSITYTKPISDIIWSHHERYDGQGYPRGLKGDEIPILAAILSVADSFDAMTTKRPYRDPFPLEKAVQEIELNSGKMYHPAVVEAFLKSAQKGNFLVEE